MRWMELKRERARPRADGNKARCKEGELEGGGGVAIGGCSK